jgi:hypothetical protein
MPKSFTIGSATTLDFSAMPTPGPSSSRLDPRPDIEEPTLDRRLFAKPWFQIAWVAVLTFAVLRLWWVRDALLVFWVYGRDAYLRQGVRVLPGKPIRFSTGELAPHVADMVTGFGFFLTVVLGLTLLLILVLRLAGRRVKPDAA